MIAVGLRLTDEVFPNPEEPIAKLPTGNENPEMLLDGVNKDGKTRVCINFVLFKVQFQKYV